jgi:hypothetical protein
MKKQSPCSNVGNTTEQKTAFYSRRNVALFPRHWLWLSAQPRSVNATLRLLVENASRDTQGKYRAQRLKEECYFCMRDLAGDSPHFEDASRALFSNDIHLLKKISEKWPSEVADKVISLATEACDGDAASANIGGI